MHNGRRQPSCGGTSRMMREYQVRICERLGVKFPGPTRHFRRIGTVPALAGCPLRPRKRPSSIEIRCVAAPRSGLTQPPGDFGTDQLCTALPAAPNADSLISKFDYRTVAIRADKREDEHAIDHSGNTH